MATASRRRSSSPTSNRRRSSSPPGAASSPYFPPDLIPEIAKRLNSLQDFFALRAACRAYRAALSLSPSNLASQAPLLLVATKQAAEQQAALLHLPLRRLLRFRLPPARQGTRSLFFSLGCRVAIRDCSTDPSDFNLRIVHLLTECRGELILVSTTEFDAKVYHVFQWNSGEAKWVRISSFGGCTLFFFSDTFVGCLGPDCPAGIRKDCMYFNGGGLWREYSSVDASFHQSDVVSPGGKLEEDFTPAGWVFPSMC